MFAREMVFPDTWSCLSRLLCAGPINRVSGFICSSPPVHLNRTRVWTTKIREKNETLIKNKKTTTTNKQTNKGSRLIYKAEMCTVIYMEFSIASSNGLLVDYT